MLDAVNKNLAPSLHFNTLDFERPMHAMQAPDVTGDTGVGAYVTPGVQALLVVGIIVSRHLEVGISGFVGLEVDIRPSAFGGVADMSLALTDALNASNPPDGACSPVLETRATTLCSDTTYDALEPSHSDPNVTFACKPADSADSCCVNFCVASAASSQQVAVCIDAWTGITKDMCACNEGLQACYDKVKGSLPAGARSRIEGWLQDQTLASITPTWNANKTCAQCDEEGLCRTEWWGRTPDDPALSECEQHGYCVWPGGTFYDMKEEDCVVANGAFHRYQCVEELTTAITGWQGPGCHPLNTGFPSACGCAEDADCAGEETCDTESSRCTTSPTTCACNPPGNGDPAVSCGSGRACLDGACVPTCVSDSDCREGYGCDAGTCVSTSGVPNAEQIAWRSDHPGPGALHAVESYGLTDILLKMIASSGVRVGAKVKVFGKKFEFMLWRWAQAWDLGSLQKAKFQPGLEASYVDECNGEVGEVTRLQARGREGRMLRSRSMRGPAGGRRVALRRVGGEPVLRDDLLGVGSMRSSADRQLRGERRAVQSARHRARV